MFEMFPSDGVVLVGGGGGGTRVGLRLRLGCYLGHCL